MPPPSLSGFTICRVRSPQLRCGYPWGQQSLSPSSSSCHCLSRNECRTLLCSASPGRAVSSPGLRLWFQTDGVGPQAAAGCFESQGHLWPTATHLRSTFGLGSPHQARPPHPSPVALSECFTAGHPQFPCSVKWAHWRGPPSWNPRVQRHVALDGTSLQSQLLRRLRQEDRLNPGI